MAPRGRRAGRAAAGAGWRVPRPATPTSPACSSTIGSMRATSSSAPAPGRPRRGWPPAPWPGGCSTSSGSRSAATSLRWAACASTVPAELPVPLNEAADRSEVRVLDPAVEAEIIRRIDQAKQAGDTLGGEVEVVARGVVRGPRQPRELGPQARRPPRRAADVDPRGEGRRDRPRLRGGPAAGLRGARSDRCRQRLRRRTGGDPRGGFRRRSNNAGGLEGGITTGEPLVVRVAMKPISTLMSPLPTVDLATGGPANAQSERSDVTAVPAMGVIAEAMVALVLADAMLEKFGGDSLGEMRRNYHGYVAALGSRWTAAPGDRHAGEPDDGRPPHPPRRAPRRRQEHRRRLVAEELGATLIDIDAAPGPPDGDAGEPDLRHAGRARVPPDRAGCRDAAWAAESRRSSCPGAAGPPSRARWSRRRRAPLLIYLTVFLPTWRPGGSPGRAPAPAGRGRPGGADAGRCSRSGSRSTLADAEVAAGKRPAAEVAAEVVALARQHGGW